MIEECNESQEPHESQESRGMKYLNHLKLWAATSAWVRPLHGSSIGGAILNMLDSFGSSNSSGVL